jgi:ABC-type nickel/cobalt efflux system permease component RcnA
MEHKIRDGRQQQSLNGMRVVFDFTRAVLILGMGLVLIFGKIPQVTSLDPLMRYMFAGLCILYGSFRLYRAIKRDY